MTGPNFPLGFGTIKVVEMNSPDSDSQGTIAPFLSNSCTS